MLTFLFTFSFSWKKGVGYIHCQVERIFQFVPYETFLTKRNRKIKMHFWRTTKQPMSDQHWLKRVAPLKKKLKRGWAFSLESLENRKLIREIEHNLDFLCREESRPSAWGNWGFCAWVRFTSNVTEATCTCTVFEYYRYALVKAYFVEKCTYSLHRNAFLVYINTLFSVRKSNYF